MYFAVMDATVNRIKVDQNGQLCVFEEESEARRYIQSFVDVDGNGVRIEAVKISLLDVAKD